MKFVLKKFVPWNLYRQDTFCVKRQKENEKVENYGTQGKTIDIVRLYMDFNGLCVINNVVVSRCDRTFSMLRGLTVGKVVGLGYLSGYILSIKGEKSPFLSEDVSSSLNSFSFAASTL